MVISWPDFSVNLLSRGNFWLDAAPPLLCAFAISAQLFDLYVAEVNCGWLRRRGGIELADSLPRIGGRKR
jgi:hypothetical protein